MKVYKPWDFCNSVQCLNVFCSKETRKVLFCGECKAYRMHQYLQENGQILEAGSELERLVELLTEKKRICKEWQAKTELATNQEFCNYVYGLKDLDCQIDELLSRLEG